MKVRSGPAGQDAVLFCEKAGFAGGFNASLARVHASRPSRAGMRDGDEGASSFGGSYGTAADSRDLGAVLAGDALAKRHE